MELLLLAWVLATIDWTAITVGIVSGLFGTLTVAGGIWAARRQFSGTAATSTGDGLLTFTADFMKIQQDGMKYTSQELASARERIAVLEADRVTDRARIRELEQERIDDRRRIEDLEAELARLKAERA